MLRLLKKPQPINQDMNKSDHGSRLDAANERINKVIAEMESVEFDLEGKLTSIKCGVKPSNGSSGQCEFKAGAKPEPKPA